MARGGKSPGDREACKRVKRVLHGVESEPPEDFDFKSSS
jgi:hypothetical protein